jgi:hypothetical protein
LSYCDISVLRLCLLCKNSTKATLPRAPSDIDVLPVATKLIQLLQQLLKQSKLLPTYQDGQVQVLQEERRWQ